MPPETSALATLAWAARAKSIAAKGGGEAAEAFLSANRVPEEVRRRIYSKAAVSAAPATGTPNLSIGEWTDSARTASAFYRLLNDNALTRLPWHARVGMITSSASAAVVGEGKGVPLSKVTIGNIILAPAKVAALIAVTDNLLLETGAAGQTMLNRELMSLISEAVDSAFISAITNGVTPTASVSALADLRTAMSTVTFVGQSRPYWIAHPSVGALAATLSDAKGGQAFQAASVSGGELAGLPLLTTTGCPASTLIFLDGRGIAANAEAPSIDASSETDLEMSSTPVGAADVPTAAQMVSMYQTDSTALMAIAYIASQRLRANAVAVINNITAATWVP